MHETRTRTPVSLAAVAVLDEVFAEATLNSVFRPICSDLKEMFPDVVPSIKSGRGFRQAATRAIAADIERHMEAAKDHLGSDASFADVHDAISQTQEASRKLDLLGELKAKATALRATHQFEFDYKFRRLNNETVSFVIPEGTSVMDLIERAIQLGAIVFPDKLAEWQNDPSFTDAHSGERVKVLISREEFLDLDKPQQEELAQLYKHPLAAEWHSAAAMLLGLIIEGADPAEGMHVRTEGKTLNLSGVGVKTSFYLDGAKSPNVTAALLLSQQTDAKRAA